MAAAGVGCQCISLAIGLQARGKESPLFNGQVRLTQLALKRTQGRGGNALQLSAHDGFDAAAGFDFWFLHACTTRDR